LLLVPASPRRQIVLLGKRGVGKSATGNTILGKYAFMKAPSSKSVTKVCLKASYFVDGKNVEVVDTPGWCDTELSEAEVVQETVQCIDMSSPGPHVFLLVVQIGRFTDEEKKTVRKIQEVFGEGASKYMMVLFTRGDDLEGQPMSHYLTNADNDLKNIVFNSCEGRYHVFNNRVKNHRQVSELLQKIQDMVRQNGGGCYTNVTYQEPHLVPQHQHHNKESPAAPLLPAETEKSTSPTPHPHHVLQRDCRKHPEHLDYCLVWELQHFRLQDPTADSEDN
uniref:AIG1-type G domain-containing protein n=1 Tax=Astyanax mexicanus TaxID=7994 RepID=A0A3B1IL10_ASTMX